MSLNMIVLIAKTGAYVQTDPADSGGANVALVEATGLNLTSITMRISIVGTRAWRLLPYGVAIKWLG